MSPLYAPPTQRLNVRPNLYSTVDPILVITTPFSTVHLTQWCTTSGPRATSGPRRVVKWPARPNRKSTISDTALTLKPTHLGLISQHLNDFKLKVQGENQ